MGTTLQTSVSGGITMYPKPFVLSFLEEKPTVYKLQLMRPNVITSKSIVAYASQAAHVPESTVTLAQDAFFDAINFFCLNGHSVQVPGLGAFGIWINSKTKKTAKEVDTDTITRKYIRFYPKVDIRNMCSLRNIHILVQDILGIKKTDNATPDAP